MPICDVAVVVLAHNGAEFTAHCIESILAAAELPRELFVVDNGSTDGTAELLSRHGPRLAVAGIAFTTWRNAENKGCSAARNEAWEKATCRHVMFLDNDAAVCTRHWLSGLAAVLDADPGIALVGPKMIYPFQPHPIQCAGVSISHLGRIAFRGRGAARHEPRFAVSADVHALISACWLMRRDLRERVGMLDELFHPVQYEDLDLCLRAAQAGWRIRYTPDVEMYHFEGMTTASIGQEEYRRNIARNSLKFRERWHGTYRHFEDEFSAECYRWLRRDELGLRPELDLSPA